MRRKAQIILDLKENSHAIHASRGADVSRVPDAAVEARSGQDAAAAKGDVVVGLRSRGGGALAGEGGVVREEGGEFVV